jgi:hypothetical protein
MKTTKMFVIGLISLIAVIGALAFLLGQEAKAKGKPLKGGPRVISLEWRRDVWQAPELRTMDDEGGNEFTVSSDPDIERGGYPRWDPTGVEIGGYQKRVTGTGDLDFDLVRIGVDGTGEQLILNGEDFDAYNGVGDIGLIEAGYAGSPFGFAAWSRPDGTQMVFAGRVGFLGTPYDFSRYRLFTVDVDVDDPLTTLSALTTEVDVFNDVDPHWSATLNKIVFVSDRTGSPQLWTVNPDGADLEQLTFLLVTGLHEPTWSHDGTHIAVSVDVGNPSPVNNYTTDRGIWILDIDHNRSRRPRDPGAAAGVVAGRRSPRHDAAVERQFPEL